MVLHADLSESGEHPIHSPVALVPGQSALFEPDLERVDHLLTGANTAASVKLRTVANDGPQGPSSMDRVAARAQSGHRRPISSFTNLQSGKTITETMNGPGKATVSADG